MILNILSVAIGIGIYKAAEYGIRKIFRKKPKEEKKEPDRYEEGIENIFSYDEAVARKAARGE
jgi:hypothetical protein